MYEKLKQVLVEEMSINPDDIKPDAELIGDLGFNSLELADLSCSARRSSTSCLRTPTCPVC